MLFHTDFFSTMSSFLHFRDRVTGLNKIFYNDPLRRSLYQLRGRAKYNEDKFVYWVSLTFAEEENVKMKSGPDRGRNRRFTGVLKDVLPTLGGKIMRIFINRLREHFRKRGFDPKTISYLWKYEEGKKEYNSDGTRKKYPFRPHFHVLLNLPRVMTWLKVGGRRRKFNLRSTIVVHRFLKHLWNHGFNYVVRIFDSEKLNGYLRKYFSKGTFLRYWKGGKKWSCSRDVVRPPKKPSDWEYVGYVSYEDAMLIARDSKKEYIELHGQKLFKFYIERLAKDIMQEFKRAKARKRNALKKVKRLVQENPHLQGKNPPSSPYVWDRIGGYYVQLLYMSDGYHLTGNKKASKIIQINKSVLPVGLSDTIIKYT